MTMFFWKLVAQIVILNGRDVSRTIWSDQFSWLLW